MTVVAMGCGAPQPSSQTPSAQPAEEATTATTTTATATTAEGTTAVADDEPTPQPEREITIDAIDIANPIVVSGRARTFENNVVLRVRDARGKLLIETTTTSTGEMGQHNPYRATLWVPRDPEGRVTVEALEYSAKDGSERSLVADTRAYDVPLIDVRLHLPDANCTRVAPVARRIPKSVAMARLLVEALLAEPHGPFPQGARVQSVNLRNGVVTVDFNERLQNVGGACAARMIRESVTATLKELPSVKSVVITAGGSEKLALQP